MNYEKNNRDDERWQKRLAEAKARAKAGGIKKSTTGKIASKYTKKKIAQGSNGIFIALILIALSVDLLEFIDLGTFSTLINLGVYIIVVVGGFVAWFFKSGKNKFSIFNLLKGQLWKYLVLPLLELVPLINIIPFWTGTVLLMWFKVKRERQKIFSKEEAAEKKKKKNLQPEYA